MTPGRTRTLSKSDFTLARTCDAKLWFRENGYPDNREYNAYLQLLAEGGYMVEALATARYPDGITLEYGGDPARDFEQTLQYLERDNVTLFQATLLSGRRMARVDILEKRGDVIRLVEVKAKSFDGAAHEASLINGGKGVFRGAKKPHPVLGAWSEKLEDVTYQTLILERVLPRAKVRPFLSLVDTSKRSALDDTPRLFEIVRTGTGEKARLHTARFNGTPDQLAALDLLTEVDVSEEVALLREDVDAAASRYENLLDSPFDPSLSSHGSKCRDCEFRPADSTSPSGFALCWGDLAGAQPHMLELVSIGSVRAPDKTPIITSLISQGKAGLLDIPEDCLCKADGTVGPQAERQLRQIRHTRSGETWISPNLRSNISGLQYPLHFIDFEVSRLALPYHAGMRPYGQVVFQWSCHTVDSPGAAPSHREWLNTEDAWPNRAFVLALREAIGESAPVITWSAFEGSRLKEILREFALFGIDDKGTAAWITDVVDRRITDIHDWAKNDYYHPGMGGRTSIKVVMDALWRSDPAMRRQFTAWTGLTADESEDPYHSLPPLVIDGQEQNVREGTGAIRAYEAMMYGVEKTDAAAKVAWGDLLRQYCKLDTLSMVLIFEHWRRATGLEAEGVSHYSLQ